MPEIGMSVSMSGDGKRSAGHRPQATAPILDSTDSAIARSNGATVLAALDRSGFPDGPSVAENAANHTMPLYSPPRSLASDWTRSADLLASCYDVAHKLLPTWHLSVSLHQPPREFAGAVDEEPCQWGGRTVL
jgi:hypothetical protein